MEAEVHVETGLQLLARLSKRPSLHGLDTVLFPNHLQCSEIVEISGNTLSGKTLLMTQLLAKCILPIKRNGIYIGGLNTGAILINTDHHFCMTTLSSFMYDTISASCKSNHRNQLNDETITNIIQSSLDNLIVISCYSSYQFKVSLISLENIILEHENIAVLMIDSISAFYWEDRMLDNIWLKNMYLKNVVKNVQKSISYFNINLIYTKPSDFFSKEKNGSDGSSLHQTVNYSIKLSRTEGNKFNCVVESNNGGKKSTEYEINSCGIKWLNKCPK